MKPVGKYSRCPILNWGVTNNQINRVNFFKMMIWWIADDTRSGLLGKVRYKYNLNIIIMKLHYKREYTSCTNYKAESYNGFGLETFIEGSDFSSSSIAVKTNFLIFILEGEIRITKDHGEASKRCRRRVHIYAFSFGLWDPDQTVRQMHLYEFFL